jgi:hypothetical protein
MYQFNTIKTQWAGTEVMFYTYIQAVLDLNLSQDTRHPKQSCFCNFNQSFQDSPLPQLLPSKFIIIHASSFDPELYTFDY